MSARILTRDIIKAAAARSYVSVEELMGRRRPRRISRPRQIAMLATRTITGESLPKIARAFNRDRTTVMHAIRALEEKPPHPFAIYEIRIAAGAIAAERQVRDLLNVREFHRNGKPVEEKVAA